MKVVVLFGGVSTEHLVSCFSAYNVVQGLRQAGHDVFLMGITKEGEWIPFHLPDEEIRATDWAEKAAAAWSTRQEKVAAGSGFAGKATAAFFSPQLFWEQAFGITPDVIYPAVHGINCEDGVLQGFLEMTGLPYVGCHVLSSAVAMDKYYAKRLWEQVGIPVVPYLLVQRHEMSTEEALAAQVQKIEDSFAYPVFLKPVNGGSSIGTTSAANREDLRRALQEVAKYDAKILVEAFISCRELEIAVLGNDELLASPVGEVIVADDIEYYDYETKYFSATGSQVVCPADIPQELSDRLRALAKKAYATLSCQGLSRVDFFMDRQTGEIYLNEINTLPGFTAISLYPKAWETAGIAQPELLTRLCELAIEAKTQGLRQEIIGG